MPPIVTDVLELLGALLLVAAAAVWAWTAVAPALGLAAAGVGVLLVSAAVEWSASRRAGSGRRR